MNSILKTETTAAGKAHVIRAMAFITGVQVVCIWLSIQFLLAFSLGAMPARLDAFEIGVLLNILGGYVLTVIRVWVRFFGGDE